MTYRLLFSLTSAAFGHQSSTRAEMSYAAEDNKIETTPFECFDEQMGIGQRFC